MRLLRSFGLWTRSLFNRPQLEADLNDELRDYVERQSQQYVAKGMSPDRARLAALRDIGGIEQAKEKCRDVRSTAWVDNTVQDARYACRTLKKYPGFALAAICTLALGIGANTAIFDVINGVLLRPLPYPRPSELVDIEEELRTGGSVSFSYPDYLDCARDSRSFQSIAAWRNRGANLTAPGDPEFLQTRQVSSSFLNVLGIHPVLGRSFTKQEDEAGTAPIAIIDYSLWRQRFDARPDAVGASLVLNGKAFTVIGVLPAGFRFLDNRSVFTPIGQSEDPQMQRRDLHPGIHVIARFRPGITIAQANAELRVIGQRLSRAFPDTDAKLTFRSISLKNELVGNSGHWLLLLGGAVGLVLLIACVNVANLFLTRSLSREREFAIRAALGAGRSRLIGQLLTESLLLSVIGGATGLLIAAVGTHWAVAHLPQWLPPNSDIKIDGRVLLFSLVASVLSGLAFGIIPGFRNQSGLEMALKQGGRGATGGVPRLQQAFVIAELTLAFVLLAGAGLMLRTIYDLWAISPGFDAHNLLTMRVAVPPAEAKDAARIRSAWRQTLDRVRHTPGVESVTLDSIIPLSGDVQTAQYWTSAGAEPPKNAPNAFFFTPTSGYLRTMKVPLARGRFFTDQDRVGSEAVMVIDENLAKTVFPGADPIGKELSAQLVGRARIIGVVGNIKHRTLDEDAYNSSLPTIYVPFFQMPDALMPLTTTGMHLLIRTAVNPAVVTNAVITSVMGAAGDTPVRDVATMEQIIGQSMAQRRGVAFLLTIFAAVALTLAAIGIYSVISYATSRRVQEIGIRMALGAEPTQVLWLVLRQGLWVIASGALIGLFASAALTRTLSKLLFGVKPADPLTFAAVTIGLCALGLFAVYFPAQRAARVDPSVALRQE